MGCYKIKCKKCKKVIKAENQLKLLFEENEHEEKKHPEIWEKNKFAKEQFDKKFKEINNELIFLEEHIFTPSKWDGEDYV